MLDKTMPFLWTSTSSVSKEFETNEISNNVVYATSKASDQSAHTRSRLNILLLLSYLQDII